MPTISNIAINSTRVNPRLKRALNRICKDASPTAAKHGWTLAKTNLCMRIKVRIILAKDEK